MLTSSLCSLLLRWLMKSSQLWLGISHSVQNQEAGSSLLTTKLMGLSHGLTKSDFFSNILGQIGKIL